MIFSQSKSSSLFSSVIAISYILSMSHFDHCASQRTPPQGAGNDPNVYMYGRGDIPIFNDGTGHGALLASLRELIIAIR